MNIKPLLYLFLLIPALSASCGSGITVSDPMRAEAARIVKTKDWGAVRKHSPDQILEIAAAHVEEVMGGWTELNAAIADALSAKGSGPEWRNGAALERLFLFYVGMHGTRIGERDLHRKLSDQAIAVVARATKDWNEGDPLEWKRRLAGHVARQFSYDGLIYPGAHGSMVEDALAFPPLIKNCLVDARGLAALALASMGAADYAPEIAGLLDRETDGHTIHALIHALDLMNAKNHANDIARLLTQTALADIWRSAANAHALGVLRRMANKDCSPHLRAFFLKADMGKDEAPAVEALDLLTALEARLTFDELRPAAEASWKVALAALRHLNRNADPTSTRDRVLWSFEKLAGKASACQIGTAWRNAGGVDERIVEQLKGDASPAARRAGITLSLCCSSNSAAAQSSALRLLDDADAGVRGVALEFLRLEDLDTCFYRARTGGTNFTSQSEYQQMARRWAALARDRCLQYLGRQLRESPDNALWGLEYLAVDLEPILADAEAFLRDSHSADRKAAFVRILAKAPGRRETKLSLLGAAVGSKDGSVRCEAIRAMADTEPAALLEKTSLIARDPAVDVRLALFRAVSRMKLDLGRHAEVLELWQSDREPRVRQELIKHLQGLDAAVLARTEDKILADTSAELRLVYFRTAQAKFPAERQPDLIDRWLKDHEDPVRSDLFQRLDDLDPSVLSTKAELFIRDPSELLRVRFLSKLAETRLKRDMKARLFKSMIRDSTPAVAAQAILGMGKVGSKDDAADLKTFLTNDRPELRAASLEALGVLRIAECEEAMAKALEDDDLGVRCAGARALGRLGAKERAEAVERLLGDPSAELRAAAADALRSLKHPLRTQDLYKLLAPSVVHIHAQFTQGSGTGSGFLIDPKGLVLTNRHVIESKAGTPAAKLTIRLYRSEKAYDCKVLRRHPELDLALVEIADPPKELPSLKIADLRPEVGEELVLIGHPKGLNWTLTEGRISQVRSLEAYPKSGEAFIQTDAAANPGNSGGPMVNKYGQVVGVLTFGKTASEGLNFGIAANVVRQFLLNSE